MTKKHKCCFHEVGFIGSISEDDDIDCANRIDGFIRDYRKEMCCHCGKEKI